MGHSKEEIIRITIDLIKASINNKKLYLADFDDEEKMRIYQFCKAHMITALVSNAILNPSNEWIQARNNSIRRTALFDAERKNCQSFLKKKESGICT